MSKNSEANRYSSEANRYSSEANRYSSEANRYFSNETGDKLVRALLAKVEEYDTFITSSGASTRNKRVYDAYFGLKPGSHAIAKQGDDGEINRISVNHLRSFITHMHVLTTQNKLAFEVSALNSDYESQAQCMLGKNILEYENNDKGLNALVLGLVEGALLYGEHFLSARWDRDGGEPVAADLEAGREVMSGAMRYALHHSHDVIRDTSLSSNRDSKWVIVREYVNKWDLATSYPEHCGAILSASGRKYKADMSLRIKGSGMLHESEDMVEMLTFFHDQTAACKQGVMAVVVGDTLVEHSPLPYRRIPVQRLAAADIHHSILGYSVAFDLLPIQEASDALMTAALTNNLTFSLQNIWCADANLAQKEIGDGLNLLISNSKPEAVQLTSSAPELYKLIDLLQQHAQLVSGVNSVARGQPEASLKSGAALSLVAAQAISFMSNLQNAYAAVVGDLGTSIIDAMQRHARAPQILAMTGKAKRSMIQVWSGDDISKIRRVSVRLGNPLQQTVAGRVNLADQMLSSGIITDGKAYLSVIETGSLDALDEVDVNENMLARSENERLSEGEDVVALLLDNHPTHILAHKSVLASPEVRKNPTLVAAVMAHIQEHINLLREVPPDLAQIAGIPSLPPPMPQDASQGGTDMGTMDTQGSMPRMPMPPDGSPEALMDAAASMPIPPGVAPQKRV